MVTQDEIDALSRKKDDELQRASALDDKIQKLEADSQKQIHTFQQRAEVYRNSGVDGDAAKASEMDHQIEQNRSFMSQEVDGLRSQAEKHRENAQQIQDEMAQKQTELQHEKEQKIREEKEKNEKEKELTKEAAEHFLL